MSKDTKPAATPEVREEAVFDADEIATNAPSLFGYSVDLARAALDYNHIERCSLEQAKKAIKGFAERKVK